MSPFSQLNLIVVQVKQLRHHTYCFYSQDHCALVNKDSEYQHKSTQYFPRFTDIKLYLRVWPDADIVFRYVAFPVNQLCCVPVRIIFLINDLVEEQPVSFDQIKSFVANQSSVCIIPTQNSLYLEYISLLKAKLVTFCSAKVVNCYCFHPESTELEVNPKRSIWVDVPTTATKY